MINSINNIDEFFIPESDSKLILPLYQAVCHMKITRKFYIGCKNAKFRFHYNVDNLGNNDNFKFNDEYFNIKLADDIVQKYIIVNAAIIIRPINIVNGYFWGSFSDAEVTNYHDAKNSWVVSCNKIIDGIRMVYIPDEYTFKEISDDGSHWANIFTEHNVNGEFEITIIKHINYIPYDNEMFTPELNDDIRMMDLKNYTIKNINNYV
jgi:hypothetical protein